MLFSPQLIARRSNVVSAGGITASAFDPAQNTNITLSNGNLTATRSSTSVGGARSTSYKSSGKFYFEVTIGAAHADTDGIGVMASTYSYGSATNGSAGNGTFYWVNDGSLNFSGGNAGNIGIGAAGSVIGIAADLTNSLSWWRRNGGLWNNSGTADPVTGANGVALAAVSLAPAVFFSSFGSPTVGDNFTANFGATTFSGTVPSGFTAGWSL